MTEMTNFNMNSQFLMLDGPQSRLTPCRPKFTSGIFQSKPCKKLKLNGIRFMPSQLRIPAFRLMDDHH